VACFFSRYKKVYEDADTGAMRLRQELLRPRKLLMEAGVEGVRLEIVSPVHHQQVGSMGGGHDEGGMEGGNNGANGTNGNAVPTTFLLETIGAVQLSSHAASGATVHRDVKGLSPDLAGVDEVCYDLFHLNLPTVNVYFTRLHAGAGGGGGGGGSFSLDGSGGKGGKGGNTLSGGGGRDGGDGRGGGGGGGRRECP
jgi:hypothetical protein